MKFVRLLKAKKIKAEEIITKDILTKAIADYDKTGEMNDTLVICVPQDIGQGYGYKIDKNWEEIQPNEVIYIPECGYREGTHIPESYYTKQDFINIIKEYANVKPSRVEPEASALFEMVDWQSPESLAYELDFDEEYEEEEE